MSRRAVFLIILTLVIGLAGTSLAYARVQQTYVLQRSVINSASGDLLQGGGYKLNAIVGQPAIGESSGTGYKVIGGYPQATPETDNVPVMNIAKSVTPIGMVNYGDLLTYTLSISATPGIELGIYDPLTSTNFVRFVEPLAGIAYTDRAITGTTMITPTNQITVSFVVQVGVPGTVGIYVDVSNTARICPAGYTISMCIWSDIVINQVYRPYAIFLPLVIRNQ